MGFSKGDTALTKTQMKQRIKDFLKSYYDRKDSLALATKAPKRPKEIVETDTSTFSIIR
jgi:hypothetical protein